MKPENVFDAKMKINNSLIREDHQTTHNICRENII